MYHGSIQDAADDVLPGHEHRVREQALVAIVEAVEGSAQANAGEWSGRWSCQLCQPLDISNGHTPHFLHKERSY